MQKLVEFEKIVAAQIQRRFVLHQQKDKIDNLEKRSLQQRFFLNKMLCTLGTPRDGLTKRGALCKKSKRGHYLVFQGRAISKKGHRHRGSNF